MKSCSKGSLCNTETQISSANIDMWEKCGNDYFTLAKYNKPKESN